MTTRFGAVRVNTSCLLRIHFISQRLLSFCHLMLAALGTRTSILEDPLQSVSTVEEVQSALG